MNGVARHDHAAEMHAAEVAHYLVVIAGDVDDLDAPARQPQQLLHHIVVGLRPPPAAPEAPAVDDVADEIEPLAGEIADEVEQQPGLAAPRAQMHVRDERGSAPNDRPIGIHGFALLRGARWPPVRLIA